MDSCLQESKHRQFPGFRLAFLLIKASCPGCMDSGGDRRSYYLSANCSTLISIDAAIFEKQLLPGAVYGGRWERAEHVEVDKTSATGISYLQSVRVSNWGLF